jgi:hypothetical protein
MGDLSWVVRLAPIPVIIHDGFSIKAASDSFQKLFDSKEVSDIDLKQCLLSRFKPGDLVDRLIENINKKQEVHLDIVGFKKGSKFKWSVHSFPIPFITGKDAANQITWFVDKSYCEIRNAYWDIHVRMNIISSHLMQKQIHLDKINLELKRSNEQLESDIVERKEREEQQRRLLKDLEDTNKIMVGRELKLIELKKEINRLSQELGRPAPYDESSLG